MIPSLFLSEEKIDSCLEKLSKETSVSFASVNIEKLKSQCDLLGEANMLDCFLTDMEKKLFAAFTYEKRRMEWLAGRIAAKHAAIKLFSTSSPKQREIKDAEWIKWEVGAEENGRPFIVPKSGKPDISISHSSTIAVAMAATKGTCGVDIQKISPRIIKVEQKFIDSQEKEFNKCACLAHLSAEKFMTLVWSAKEALRKGSGHKSVIGFMEMKLNTVTAERDNGLIFEFVCTREPGINQSKKIFTTCQAISDDFVVSFTSSLFSGFGDS